MFRSWRKRERERLPKAVLEQARLDLERTILRAPFDGRVRSESVGISQLVGRAVPLARIYSTDVAEIRLPLADADLAHLELSLATFGEGPPADVTTSFAGLSLVWPARIARVEGQVDAATQMVHVVAVVEDPYGRKVAADGPPLAAGMFVDVAIKGRTAHGVFALPRAALRDEDQVLIVDADSRLRRRTASVCFWAMWPRCATALRKQAKARDSMDRRPFFSTSSVSATRAP